MRALLPISCVLVACASTVPQEVHKKALEDQSASYETRLKRAEEARQRSEAQAAALTDEQTRGRRSLLSRIHRLEAALADRQRLLDDAIAGRRTSPTPALESVRRALERSVGDETGAGLRFDTKGAALIATLAADFIFDPGSRRIARRSDALVASIAQVVAKASSLAVQIRVHADGIASQGPRGALESFELTEEQGRVVLAALLAQGVDASRLSVAAFGAFRPVAPDDTAEGRAQNRRLEIVLSPLVP